MARPWTDPEYTEDVTVTETRGKSTIHHTFKVEIEAAEEDSWHDAVRGSVTVHWPVLRVTTHETYDDAGTITIRGVEYTVDTVHMAERRGGETYWMDSRRDHHSRGIRNDNGLPPGPVTAGQLKALAAQARDKFVAEHPDWETRSQARRLAAAVARENAEAAQLRKRADEHDAAAAKLQAELDALTGADTGKTYDHDARPDDDPEPGDRCKDCGEDITWLGPSQRDWLHVDDVRNQ